MTVSILSTSDDPRKVHKTFTTIRAAVTCTPTQSCSILSPRIIIDNNFVSANATHIYIPDWNRYYYIRDISLATAKECVISADIDVLTTYAAALASCPCIVTRSQSVGSPTPIPDNKLPVDPNREEILSILFNKDPFNVDPLNGSCWQLTTMGGEGS